MQSVAYQGHDEVIFNRSLAELVTAGIIVFSVDGAYIDDAETVSLAWGQGHVGIRASASGRVNICSIEQHIVRGRRASSLGDRHKIISGSVVPAAIIRC